jgi:hypothetical protein
VLLQNEKSGFETREKMNKLSFHNVSNHCKENGKGKGKVHPRTGHEGPEGE